MRRLGVDVGGTFTDLIYVDDEAGQILVHKLPTTPDDPSQGTVQGIRELTELAGTQPSDLEQVFHGTTIATNIVIEHDGAQVGLITTARAGPPAEGRRGRGGRRLLPLLVPEPGARGAGRGDREGGVP